MSRAVSINGTGTRFYGISNPDEQGKITATLWFTFLFFPVFPISRYSMTRALTHPREFRYTIIEKQNLVWSEVFMTWLWGWIITPVLWFGPLLLCIREVITALGVKRESTQDTFMGVAILYLIVFTWLWKDWLDKQGLPKNYKQLLKKTGPASA